jgi:predicted secreted Zn-dependent protease
MANTASVPIALSITYRCYDITGGSAQTIRSSIDTSPGRPTDPQTGTAYDAYTKWRYELHWTLKTSDGACRATVSSTLTVEQTFPHWVASTSSSNALAQQWNSYLSALKVHEDGHKQIGVDTTNDAIARVSALGVASCNDFNAKAQAAIDAATSRGKQLESEYDTATGHGSTQGARFP